MPQKDQSTADLLMELKQTVDAIGVPGTINLLRNSRQQFSPDKNIQFIVLSVCNTLQISFDDLFSNKNDEVIKYGKAFIIYYLRRPGFETPWKDIKILLDHRNQSWLHELRKLVDHLKPHLRAHAVWCAAKDTLDKLINEYKNHP